jgi:ankyrin repeat domain-containing protein 50
LTDAIAINVEDDEEPFLDPDLELFDTGAFLDACSSLLTTYYRQKHSKAEGEETDHANDDVDDVDENVFVKFAHFSVLEFLRSDDSKSVRKDLVLEDRLAHSVLAKCCLAYIHQFSSPTAAPDNQAPALIQYAASSWLKHFLPCDRDSWNSSAARRLLHDMFEVNSNSFACWLKYASIDKPWKYDNWTMSRWDATTQQTVTTHSRPYSQPTPLYCAAIAGLVDVSEVLLDSGADPNVKCGIYGYALQAAVASSGSVKLVELLVKAGADLDADGGQYGSAMAAAATFGQTEIVRILLEAGASAQLQGRRYRMSDRTNDPLFMAAKGGHLDVINLLLEYGAEDWHEMKGRPCTALSAAMQTGRIDIVKTMLKHPRIRDVNTHELRGIIRSQSSGMNQGLFYSASLGHKNVLRELADELNDAEMLRYAAKAGDEDLMLQSMAKMAEVDAEGQFDDHPRALQSAALGGHLAIVRRLLTSGADPNLKTDYSTPLCDSIRGKNLEVAEALIEAGAKVTCDWPSPMLQALSYERWDFMQLFVSHGADPSECFVRCVYDGNFKAFTNLIELGADTTRAKLVEDISLLQTAAFGGSVNILRYLLEHGHDLEGITQTHPLTEAIRCDRLAAAHFLLDRHANVNASPTTYNDPGEWGGSMIEGHCWPPKAAYDIPLSAAVRRGNLTIVVRLLEAGALVNPDLPETCGSPLLFAVDKQSVEIVRLLLKHEASPNKAGTVLKRQKTSYPLLLAAERGDLEILEALLEAGASINQQDAEGFSAMHIAARSPSNVECLRRLVDSPGADLTLRLQNGSQPLHSAAARGDVERVQILVDAGADVDAQNHTGRTPLHWAAEAENCEIVAKLLYLGADATQTADDAAVTAWDLMCLADVKTQKHGRAQGEERSKELMKTRDLLEEFMLAQERNKVASK